MRWLSRTYQTSNGFTIAQQELVNDEVSRRTEIKFLQRKIHWIYVKQFYEVHALAIWFLLDVAALAAMYWISYNRPWWVI